MSRYLFVAISLLFSLSLHAAELNVSAASSLTDALKAIAPEYEKQSGDHVIFNFAASSALARQIEEGAPADLFFSADEAQMDRLQKADRIEEKSRRNLLSNTLVVVAPNESTMQLTSAADLRKVERIAVGDPKLVPVGVYTRSYLEKSGLWQELEAKIIPTENVRAGLAVVESGNAEVAFVYKTDAAISKKVKIIFSVPPDEKAPINYPAALVKRDASNPAAEKFLSYLSSEAAGKIFEQFGFIVKH